MKKAYFILVVFLLVAILAIPRFVGLDKFISLDEPFWVRNGANFYYALGQRQFENTVYNYHPAITTLWVGAIGMLAYFPKYRVLQEGYLTKDQFDGFLIQHGKSELGLFLYSRSVQVIVIVLLLLTIFFLLRYLLGNQTAFLTTAFVSLSPFFLGNSRLLNHVAMMGLFVLVSFFSMMIYLFKKKNLFLLLFSAIAGALAQLTLTTGFLLLPVIGLVLISHLIESREVFYWKRILETLRTFSIWLVGLIAAYFLFWPGMWVDPEKMLSQVYGHTLYFSLGISNIFAPSKMTLSHFSLSSASEMLSTAETFVLQMLWHTTPLTWIGFIVGISFIFIQQKKPTEHLYKWTILYSVIIAILYILLFSVAAGKDSAHYILASYLGVDIVAGLGLSTLLEKLSEKWFAKNQSVMMIGGILALVVIQIVFIIGYYPYYYTYLNPLMQIAPAAAKAPIYEDPSYGEGLELAAAYLSQKPEADRMTVMSYGGYGCFSFFFPGKTLVINDVSTINPNPAVIKYLQASSYAVLDHRYQEAFNDLAGFEGLTPERTIWLNGIEYFDIYRAADLLERINVNLSNK
jgi:hypothetical protein